ncbi:MAG: hypothetical protein ACLQF0_11520 [Dissulfurispiraceae bacterium]
MPEDGNTYTAEIIDRCLDLIFHGIWSGIDQMRLRRWFANFCTDEEKYFAACILDSLIYRSEDQTISLIWHLFQRILPDLIRYDSSPIGDTIDWQNALKRESSATDPLIRLVTVVRRSDPPTKSAYVIARLMKRHLFIDERWIIKPWEVSDKIKQGVKIFLFIDDFLGTGDQFTSFFKSEDLVKQLPHIYAAYVPLVAHQTGVKHLRDTFSGLRVTSVETLDDSHNIFGNDSSCFKDGTNTPDIAKQFYYELLRTRKMFISETGYGDLGLTYAFSHAAPDNCLPLLWWPHAVSWSPLFDR